MVLCAVVWTKEEETVRNQQLVLRRERNGMHFHSRKRSKKGIAGFALSLISVLAFLALCIVSALAKGEAGFFIGVLGFCVLALCCLAFSLSLKGLKERDVYTTIPFIGLVISGALVVFLFCLYVLGIQF